MTSETDPLFLKRIAIFVLGRRRLCLLVFALITALFASGIPNLYIDNSMNNLFLAEDPNLELFDATIEEYGTELGMVIAFRPGKVFENEFLQTLDRVTQRIRDVENVERVFSLTHLDHIQARGEEIWIGPLVQHIPSPPDALKEAKERALADPFVKGNVLSGDASTTAVAIRFAYLPDDDTYGNIAVERVNRILAEEVGDRFEYHTSGIFTLVAVMNDYCLQDLEIFLPIGILLNILILSFVYRSAAGVLVTLGATSLSVMWTMGLMGLFHLPITVGTTMLPVLIMVISVSDAVHLITQYYEGIGHGQKKDKALETAIVKVGTPCFLTSITTGMGFSSLLLSDLRPVRDFGLFAAIGIFFAFVIFIFLVPVALSYLKTPSLQATNRLKTGRASRTMNRISRMTWNHPYKILVTGAVIMGLGIYGITKIRVDTKFYDYFYESDPFTQSIRFIDRNLTGIEPLRILLNTGREGGIKDPAFLRKVDDLEAFLRTYPEVSRVTAMPDLLRRMHRLMNEDNPEYERLPASREVIAEYIFLLSLAGGDELMELLANYDLSTAQVVAMLRLVGTSRQEAIVRDLEVYLEKNFQQPISCQTTGAAALNATIANHLVRSQIKTFAVAFVLIFCAMTLLFRSIRIGLLSIVPNIIPLTLTAGLMGFSGISLNVVTVMVASVAIGIAVDDTIHILAQYRLEFGENPDPAEAMRRTLLSSGRAVVFTSIVLMAGFLIPLFSKFRLPCYFGILASTTMVGALFGDLILTPAILRVARPFAKIRARKDRKALKKTT